MNTSTFPVDQSKNWTLVLRISNADLSSQAGFKWPDYGPVSCPTTCLAKCGSSCQCVWKKNGQCANGLHGWEHGIGDISVTDAWQRPGCKWQLILVEDAEDNIDRLDGKVKFREGFVIYTGDQAGYDAMLRKIEADQPKQIGRARGLANAVTAETYTKCHDALRETERERDGERTRAEAAEKRLADLRGKVEGLTRWKADITTVGDVHLYMHSLGDVFKVSEVLAMLEDVTR